MVKAFAWFPLKRLMSLQLNSLLGVFISLLLFQTAMAQTQLSASVDRSKIYEMDTLNLTVEGEIDVDFSFGGLMNFGLNQSEKPDTSLIERDFEILDTQQSYNMQSINGEAKAKVLWRYSLAPKQAGILEIPPIKFKDAETKPIQITVIEGKAPKNSSEPPAVFLEVETDKTEAYVQEQIIYTLRLYTQGLINGELSEPSSADAIIEPFGEQKKYYRMAFNQRYEVVERRYLIFPQKSGRLEIGQQEFQGVTIKQGRRSRIRDVSESVEITIKAPPASFSGKTWLPATSLFINEEWQGDPSAVKVGDSLSRKIVLSSLGLLGSALPPASMSQNAGYKLYTDKPQIETVQHESGAQATRIDTFAIVPLKEGEISLDEIRIPWWDIVNDVERVAVIPATKLRIIRNPDMATSALNPSAPTQQAVDSPEQAEQTNPNSLRQADIQSANPEAAASQSHLWQTLAAILLILWLVTCVFFYRKIQELKAHLNARPFPKPADELDEKQLYEEAVKAVKTSDRNLLQAVFKWLESFDDLHSSKYQTINLQTLKSVHQDLYQQLSRYEEQLYGTEAVHNEFDTQSLLNILKQLRQEKRKAVDEASTGSEQLIKKRTLEPFYQ